MKKRRPTGFLPASPDGLEARQLLSTLGASPPAEISVLGGSSHRDLRLGLKGRVSGSAEVTVPPEVIADAGITTTLKGTGKLERLGKVSISGSLYSGGFRPVEAPAATGTLLVKTERGNLRLRLESVATTAETPISAPPSYRFSIVGGTGRLARAYGRGTAEFRFVGPPVVLDPGSSYPLQFDLTLAPRNQGKA